MLPWALRFLAVLSCHVALAVKPSTDANQSVGDIVQEALEGNLGELQSELTKLQKGLRLAKTYLNDSTTELENLRAEVAKSNLSQELKVAEKKYEELQAEAEKVSLEENRLWKETLEQEEKMAKAKKRYHRAMQQLEVNKAALKKKAQRLANVTNVSEADSELHSGSVTEKCGAFLLAILATVHLA